MDGLCELTARMQRNRRAYEIPAPDYDTDDDNSQRESTLEMENDGDIYEGEGQHGSLSPEQIRSMMSKEQKELQRDLKIMQKGGVNFKSKRPEFKVKHHEIMSKGIQRKESNEAKESELSTKLRTRSEQIQQAENAQKCEDDKPEFMKVNLKKRNTAPTT